MEKLLAEAMGLNRTLTKLGYDVTDGACRKKVEDALTRNRVGM